MTIEEQVVSLELSKKLKELGQKQESLFCWVLIVQTEMWWELRAVEDVKKWQSNPEWYSAFTVAELVSLLTELKYNDIISLREVSADFLANKLINHYEKLGKK